LVYPLKRPDTYIPPAISVGDSLFRRLNTLFLCRTPLFFRSLKGPSHRFIIYPNYHIRDTHTSALPSSDQFQSITPPRSQKTRTIQPQNVNLGGFCGLQQIAFASLSLRPDLLQSTLLLITLQLLKALAQIFQHNAHIPARSLRFQHGSCGSFHW